MIPKIIHYCWFGNGPKPQEFEKWLASWKKNLPDYEIKEWNESNFDPTLTKFSQEAYGSGNMAFVSDVCRIYALNQEGGIYLDTDVEILRNLDHLLETKNGFMGYETEKIIGTGLLASEKGSEWTRKMLDYYRNHHFISWWGHPTRIPNTYLLTKDVIPFLDKKDWPYIFPLGIIVGHEKNMDVQLAYPTSKSIAVHHYESSWIGKDKDGKKRKRTIKEKIRNLVIGMRERYFKSIG